MTTKTNLYLINFSLSLIYDFSFGVARKKGRQARNSCRWVECIPLDEIFHTKNIRFDPQKYVTNFSRANRSTINPSLMLSP